jgi:hypothetical protein
MSSSDVYLMAVKRWQTLGEEPVGEATAKAKTQCLISIAEHHVQLGCKNKDRFLAAMVKDVGEFGEDIMKQVYDIAMTKQGLASEIESWDYDEEAEKLLFEIALLEAEIEALKAEDSKAGGVDTAPAPTPKKQAVIESQRLDAAAKPSQLQEGHQDSISAKAEQPEGAQGYAWLRWLCVLPASIVGVIVFNLVAHLVARLPNPDDALIQGGRWLLFKNDLFRAFGTPYFFVLSGALTAPAYKAATAKCLSALVLGFWSFALIYLESDSKTQGLINFEGFFLPFLVNCAALYVAVWHSERE